MGQFVQHAPQQLGRDNPLGARVPFGKGSLADAVNGHEEVLLAVFGLDLGKIDVPIADGVVLAFLFRRALPVFVQRQAADAVALKAEVQRGAGPVRNRGLPRLQAIVPGQERMPPEGHGEGFLLGAAHRRYLCRYRFRAHARIPHAGALAPRGRRFRIGAVARS